MRSGAVESMLKFQRKIYLYHNAVVLLALIDP